VSGRCAPSRMIPCAGGGRALELLRSSPGAALLPMPATTHGPCKRISVIATFSTRSGTPSWRRTGSRIFGDERHRNPTSEPRTCLHANDLPLGYSMPLIPESCSFVQRGQFAKGIFVAIQEPPLANYRFNPRFSDSIDFVVVGESPLHRQ
jgi:hypothetical protein